MLRASLFILGLMTPIFYIAWSLLNPIRNQSLIFCLASLGYAVIVGFVLYLPLSFRRARSGGKRVVHPVVSWITYFGMGFLSFALTFCIFKDFAALVFLAFDPKISLVFESALSTCVVVFLDLLSLGVSVYLAQFRIQLEHVKIPIRGLPAALEGFKILQLSDIHLGPTIGAPFIRRILSATQHLITSGLNPDIVVITGDIADALPSDVQDALNILDQLPCRRGRFYVFGNHELYWGMPAWVEEMKRRNYGVLNNIHALIEVEPLGKQSANQLKPATLAICGVTDTSTDHFFPAEASDPTLPLMGLPTDAFRLLLCHQPHLAEKNADLGYQLQLSGHTHGGQFAPWVWAIYFFQRYVRGLYTVGNAPTEMQLYVHRGTGTWGPPFRLGSPPELALLELIPALNPV